MSDEAQKRSLNVSALFVALDSRRAAHRMSWRDVAREVGCGASAFTRISLGDQPGLASYLAITGWLGCSAEDFVEGPRPSEEEAQRTVDEIASFLRKDNALKPESAAAIESIVRAAYGQMAAPTVTRDPADKPIPPFAGGEQ